MRKIIIIAIIVLAAITKANAQTNYTPAGKWKYINGTDTLEVFFRTDVLIAGTDTFPVIKGWHKYTKNGLLIESDLANAFAISGIGRNKYSILLYNFYPAESKLQGKISDLSLNYKRDLLIKKIDPNTIQVTVTMLENWNRNRPANNAYTLPRHFTLIKQ